MKIKRLAFFIFVLFVQISVNAQDYAFKVLVNKGKNEMKSGTSWQPVKVGTSLKSADEIKISDDAYLGLVHVSGKPIELKQSGKYKVIDLAAKVSGTTSVLNKYTDFILSSNASPKGNLNAAGSVHRGTNSLVVYLPSPSSVIYNTNVSIFWDTALAKGPYQVMFSSMFGDELKKITTEDGEVSINLDDPKFQLEDNILIKVISTSDNKTSADFSLKRMSKADKERIKNQLTGTEEETSMNKLLLAAFFEENNLLVDALDHYHQAMEIAPEVPYFAEKYQEFLQRQFIKTPTKE